MTIKLVCFNQSQDHQSQEQSQRCGRLWGLNDHPGSPFTEPLAWLSLKPRESICWHFFTQQSRLIMQLRVTWFSHFLWDRQTDRQRVILCGFKAESSCFQNKHCLWETFHYINKPEDSLLMAIRSAAGPSVCNFSSDGVGDAVTPERLLLLLLTLFYKDTSHHQLFRLAFCCIDFSSVSPFKSKKSEQRTRRVPDDTSITRWFTTIRGRRSSCRHVDDVSAFLSPGLTLLPTGVSRSNRPRPSRPSTRGRAASSTDNSRWFWGSQRLRQLQQPPSSVSSGFQIAIGGPPRGPPNQKPRFYFSSQPLPSHR